MNMETNKWCFMKYLYLLKNGLEEKNTSQIFPKCWKQTTVESKVFFKKQIPEFNSPKPETNILREPQHTPGAHPRHPQSLKWKEFRTINCWLGVWGMLQGYVGKFLET